MESEGFIEAARARQFVFLLCIRKHNQRCDEHSDGQHDQPRGTRGDSAKRIRTGQKMLCTALIEQAARRHRNKFSRGRNRAAVFRPGRPWPSLVLRRISARGRLPCFSRLLPRRGISLRRPRRARGAARAVSSRSTDEGGLGGGTCESTTPSSRSTVSFAVQQGQLTSNVSIGFFAMPPFYAILGSARQRQGDRVRRRLNGHFRAKGPGRAADA